MTQPPCHHPHHGFDAIPNLHENTFNSLNNKLLNLSQFTITLNTITGAHLIRLAHQPVTLRLPIPQHDDLRP